MEKVKTIGIYRDFIDVLSEAINEELEKNNITADKLIDIKFAAKSGSGKFALIIYKET